MFDDIDRDPVVDARDEREFIEHLRREGKWCSAWDREIQLAREAREAELLEVEGVATRLAMEFTAAV